MLSQTIAIIVALIATLFTPFVTSATADESMIDLLHDISNQSDNYKALSGTESGNPNTSSRSSRPKENVIDGEQILKPFRPEQPMGEDEHLASRERTLPTLTLKELEKDFRAAPEVLVAVADLEESLSMLEQKRARSGLKVFGGAGIGTYREPVTDTVVRDFQRASVRAGLRYPLLGSLAQERIDVLKAEATTRQKEQEIELVTHKSLATLRTFYINYWGSQKKMELGQAFLDNETEVEQILAHRTSAGYLLDADRQEFLSAFALVRRNMANLKITQNRALNVLRLISRPELKAFVPVTPRLTTPCLDRVKLKAVVIDTHPEINMLRKQLEDQLAIQQATRKTDIKADVSLAGMASQDLPAEEGGYGVAINFSVELPAKIKQANTARREGRQAALKKIQRQMDLKSATLWQEAEETLDRFQAALKNMDFATQRLKAGMEGVRENLLRSAYLEGDTIEQLQKSRYAYYQSAIDYIDAEKNRMLAQARLLQYGEGCQPKTAEVVIKKASHQPNGPGSPVIKKQLPLILSDTATFPIEGNFSQEKRRETPRAANRNPNRNLVLNELVVVNKDVPSSTRQPPHSIREQSAASGPSEPCDLDCYTVQVGSYRHLSGAQAIKQRLDNGPHKVVILPVTLPEKGRWYRVQMGEFVNAADAKNWVEHLAEAYGREAYVVHLKK